jgi:hypothetical protein
MSCERWCRLWRWRAMHIHPTVDDRIPYVFDELRPLEWSSAPPRPSPNFLPG